MCISKFSGSLVTFIKYKMHGLTKYELMMVTVPTAAGESLVGRFEKILKDASVTVKVTNMGRKKLGYPIRKLTDADYFLLDFETEGKVVLPVLSRLRLEQEDLLRYMLVKKKTFKPSKKKHGKLEVKAEEKADVPKAPKVTVVTKVSEKKVEKVKKTEKVEGKAKKK